LKDFERVSEMSFLYLMGGIVALAFSSTSLSRF